MIVNNWLAFISLFAAAGGGGSSSSNDGGGGISVLMFLAGFLPMSKLGKKYRVAKQKNRDEVAFQAGQSKTWSIAIGLAAAFIVLGLIVVPLVWYVFLVIPFAVGLIVGAGDGLYGWLNKFKPNKKIQADLAAAAANDKVWDEEFLKKGAANIFQLYQRDWSNFNLASMKTYMTPSYYRQAGLMMKEMHNMKRRNVVSVELLDTIEITNMSNQSNDNHDRFVAGISADVSEQLIDASTKTVLWKNKGSIHEYWQFARDGQSWRLDSILPLTADLTTRNQEIKKFALSHGAFYSLDWGRLLIPTRGQLFSNGSLAYSDINNHVIGQMTSTGRAIADDIIYQIYTYSENPARSGSKIYLIGQITVPKYYGDILVRRRKGIFQFGVKGLKEVTTEWADFNKKFQVFATSPEQVTSFELLNPKMMEWLEAATFEVNLEVIDNSIYFYAELKNTEAKDYKTMLDILQMAYRELKL